MNPPARGRFIPERLASPRGRNGDSSATHPAGPSSSTWANPGRPAGSSSAGDLVGRAVHRRLPPRRRACRESQRRLDLSWSKPGSVVSLWSCVLSAKLCDPPRAMSRHPWLHRRRAQDARRRSHRSGWPLVFDLGPHHVAKRSIVSVVEANWAAARVGSRPRDCGSEFGCRRHPDRGALVRRVAVDPRDRLRCSAPAAAGRASSAVQDGRSARDASKRRPVAIGMQKKPNRRRR